MKWIPIGTVMPRWRERVLASHRGFVSIVEYVRHPFPPHRPCFSTGCGWEPVEDYDAWMPLPEPPKEATDAR